MSNDLKARGELRNSKQESWVDESIFCMQLGARIAPAKKVHPQNCVGIYNFEMIGRQICRYSHPTLSTLLNPQSTCILLHSLYFHFEPAAILHFTIVISLLFSFHTSSINSYLTAMAGFYQGDRDFHSNYSY